MCNILAIFNEYYFTEDIHYLPQSGYYNLLPSCVIISEMWEEREYDVCMYVCICISYFELRMSQCLIFCTFACLGSALISICCKNKKKKLLL